MRSKVTAIMVAMSVTMAAHAQASFAASPHELAPIRAGAPAAGSDLVAGNASAAIGGAIALLIVVLLATGDIDVDFDDPQSP